MKTAVGSAAGGCGVRCVDVRHVYELGGDEALALSDIALTIPPGERVALFGASGSGKSTLASLITGLRRPSAGQIWLGDEELTAMSERQLLRMRAITVGVVLQNPSRTLLPYGTVTDNLRFAARPARRLGRTDLPEPAQLLRQLGLDVLAEQPVAKLSGGEQQRLSVAVAMAGLPRLLVADEPTSQLDSHNRDRVVELLGRAADEFGTTMIVITHDPVVADSLPRRITLSAGQIVEDGPPTGSIDRPDR